MFKFLSFFWNFECIKNSDFIYTIKLLLNNAISDEDFIVYGQEITFEKQALVVKNKKSLEENALSLYTHPNCELVQSKSHAINIAAGIMRSQAEAEYLFPQANQKTEE